MRELRPRLMVGINGSWAGREGDDGDETFLERNNNKDVDGGVITSFSVGCFCLLSLKASRSSPHAR